MIKHHGGALVMVKELFGTPGAGQDGDISRSPRNVEATSRWKSIAWARCSGSCRNEVSDDSGVATAALGAVS